jgi:hypothetical protein
MRNFLMTLLVVPLFFAQRPAVAAPTWGAQGHRLIVEMAIGLLNPTARQRVMSILHGYPIDDAVVRLANVLNSAFGGQS